MSAIESLLSRLDKVKRGAGRNSWTARCPAHEDKGPSLSISYEGDGRILLHCFAGCEVDNVVGAVGMGLSDLMPPKDSYDPHTPTIKLRIPALDLLRVIKLEADIVIMAALMMSKGEALKAEDFDRLKTAYERIDYALERADV